MHHLTEPGTLIAEHLRAHRERVRQRAALLEARADALGAAHLPRWSLPTNDRGLEPVPTAWRETFVARMRSASQAPHAGPDEASRPAPAPATMLDDGEELAPAVAGLLARCCAVCRGACCASGKEHAFLRGERLRQVRERFAHLDDDAFAAAYAERIPAEHVADACLFLTPDGCTLPRDMRADLCNRFLCGELTQIRRSVEQDGVPHAILAAAADSYNLRRVAVVTPTAHAVLPE